MVDRVAVRNKPVARKLPVGGHVTKVPDAVLYHVLGTIAAVIEEPYCMLGSDELQGLVRSHRALLRSLGDFDPDYAVKGRKAFNARARGQVVKTAMTAEACRALTECINDPRPRAQ